MPFILYRGNIEYLTSKPSKWRPSYNARNIGRLKKSHYILLVV